MFFCQIPFMDIVRMSSKAMNTTTLANLDFISSKVKDKSGFFLLMLYYIIELLRTHVSIVGLLNN